MSLTLPDRYKAFFEESLERWAPASKYAVLRTLDGGRTSAAVFLVDIAQSAVAKTRPSGQYVLKLQAKSDIWDALTECDCHQAAFQRNTDFATKHIPVLAEHAESAEFICMLYEIAGRSLVL